MGKWVHRLDKESIDLEAAVAHCANCGVVPLYISPGGQYKCMKAYTDNLTDQKKRTGHEVLRIPKPQAVRLREEAGHCQVCGSTNQLEVEHCHKTGNVRGVVCKSCNRWIGSLERMGLYKLKLLVRFLGWDLS